MELRNEILDDYTRYCERKIREEFRAKTPNQYDPIYSYQRYKCRIIESIPREVKEAKCLSVPNEYCSAYAKIKKDIETGEPLRKYQSRKLKQLDYDDDMLSHWGIQHLHLSDELQGDGFVQRTGDLLFVHFDNCSARIIGIFNHSSWCDLDLIEIMHSNWPDRMSAFRMESGIRKLTEEEHKVLRGKHANANIVLDDGTEYMNPGFGVTSNGSPINAVLNSDKVIAMLNHQFETIKVNMPQILEAAKCRETLNNVTIGLEVDNRTKQLVFKIKEIDFYFTI
ncbi:hypothetical protein M2F96_22255 [Vibrio vulnificus]|uniref:hypothetical protein n=1 Tax=Vibrio vulnificus TaxID=672 RepID=UPI00092A79ED|nr:hypothetical protein [Vibrio vulnificus]ELH7532800.1 hypothetical protein [Vibrio vulnificus]MCU8523409.1 hypothetical protein [Vibrio vulnificus]OJH73976.1 hypothetical protein VVS222_03988 [Vibrio vulnificus]POB56638.1 hypothetical protein CRN26_06685 [Vibrio vulnificus]